MASHRSSEASKRVIDETKRLYADILAKPLDDRLLARPSFKFIQEIVKNLITETKTLRNVFNHADFETENKTWDRRRKCEFVQRLIDFAANHKQPVVGCVADKLVAGLEPNKANELLQSLAKIAQARLAGQDGPPNRPRTFTRRSPSSVSSPKQPTDAIASDSPRSSQQAATGGGARNSGVGLAANKSTPSQRNVNGNRSRTTAPRKVTQQPSTRDVSASSSRVGSSRRTSSQTNQSDEATRSRVSSVVGTNDARQLLHDNSVEPAEETREVPSRRTSGNTETGVYHNTPSKKQSASKLSLGSAPKGGPAAAGSGVKSLQDIIVSESDINKNIQQLRSNLDQLRYNLLEMSQFDVKLRTDLKAFIR